MQTRHQIALLTAGLLVGAQIGVASMGTPISDTGEQVEPVPSEAHAWEGGTSGGDADAQADATRIAAEGEQAGAGAIPLASAADANQPAIPQGTAFPSTHPDPDWPMLPATLAYLERTAHLRLTGASGNVFPPSTDDVTMLPALAAYLEQRHVAVLAEYGLQPAVDPVAVAATPTAPGEATVTTGNGQESERQVSLIDRIRNLF